jgi:hypothetical protein
MDEWISRTLWGILNFVRGISNRANAKKNFK